ncbi:MAG TPA: glycosyltransferase, partial [Bacteroidales bacterium]|nr:glycosyltransferase [Bacteroidales bacterium]
DVAIVPLLSGSGIRIKIIEAMAAGKTVITTEIGAEGILYQNNHNILIANTKLDFVNAVSRIINKPGLYHEIGANARKLIEEVYDKKQIVRRLLIFYENIQKQNALR